MRLEHHLVGGYVRYISPYIIIIIIILSIDFRDCPFGGKTKHMYICPGI